MLSDFPFVSLAWIYYNSMHKKEYIKRSLESILELDYPKDKYELVIVDNGSTDGGYEFLREFKEENEREFKIKLIRNPENLGYEGGANTGYRARSPEARYFGIINNDAYVESEYLKDLVKILEKDKNIGAVQPILLKWSKEEVDSSGAFLTEFLGIKQLHTLKNFETDAQSLIPVTYVEGTAPLYKIEAIGLAHPTNDRIFIPGAFVYWLEDVFLGLKLWNIGFKSVSYVKIMGKHYRFLVTKESSKKLADLIFYYYATRNRTAFLTITNSRYNPLIKTISYSGVLLYGAFYVLSQIDGKSIQRKNKLFKLKCMAILEGIELGKKLLKEYGKLDLYKGPIIKEKGLKGLSESIWFSGGDIRSILTEDY